MKTKKATAITLSSVIAAVLIIALILTPFIKKSLENSEIRNYLNEDLRQIDDVILISDCMTVDGIPDSAAGFKEAVRLGADAVKIDLCFKKDGTPVMADDYDRCEKAQSVENLFRTMNEDEYKDITVYLNIIQLSDMTVLNRLAVQYSVLDRLYLTGIDSLHYKLITSDDTIIPFLLTYDITEDDIEAASDRTFKEPDCIRKYGAAGLVISYGSCTPEIMDAFSELGIITVYTDIKSSSTFCRALADGASCIYVRDIKRASDILNNWASVMQERHEISVENSLNSLTNTAK